MCSEEDFMELFSNFPSLLINYKMGYSYKEIIPYHKKKGWELVLDYIQKH